MSRRSAIGEWSGVSHLRIRHDVTDSPAWRVLGFSAKALYTDLRAKLRSTNNGNINATLSEMKHRGWTSPTTLSKALRQLEHMGFIAKTRQGGIASMSKVCSLYRFTDLSVPEWPKLGINAQKATFDYLQFESVKAAKAEFQRAFGTIRKKSKLQKMELLATENVAMNGSIATETVQETPSKLQKLYKRKSAETRASVGYQPK